MADEAEAIYVSGPYAFVAAEYAGLRIIDISNPTSPIEIGHYSRDWPAYGVYVDGQYAFVSFRDGIYVLDASNPKTPYEVGHYNILVNAVCPGWTKTKRVEEIVHTMALKTGKKDKDVLEELSKNIPLNRMARPEEIAHLVVFLASEKASYITGAAIQVDGGFIQSIY